MITYLRTKSTTIRSVDDSRATRQRVCFCLLCVFSPACVFSSAPHPMCRSQARGQSIWLADVFQKLRLPEFAQRLRYLPEFAQLLVAFVCLPECCVALFRLVFLFRVVLVGECLLHPFPFPFCREASGGSRRSCPGSCQMCSSADRKTLPMLPRVKATEGWFVRWWTARSWVACCVCTMQAWQEERVQAYIAGDACCFRNFEAVVDLLSPSKYISTWPMVPAEEIRASAVDLQMPTEETPKKDTPSRTPSQKPFYPPAFPRSLAFPPSLHQPPPSLPLTLSLPVAYEKRIHTFVKLVAVVDANSPLQRTLSVMSLTSKYCPR